MAHKINPRHAGLVQLYLFGIKYTKLNRRARRVPGACVYIYLRNGSMYVHTPVSAFAEKGIFYNKTT